MPPAAGPGATATAELDATLFEAAFDGAPIGIAIVGEDGRIVRANRALGELFGHPTEQLIGRTVHGFGHPDDDDIRLADRAAIASGALERSSYVKRHLDGSGQPVWLKVSTSRIDSRGRPLFLSHFVDVTTQEQATRRVAHAATHDPLTGLANRSRLMELLAEALPDRHVPDGAEPEGAGRPPVAADVALLFIDLDDFKVVNDSLGHETGDQVLRVAGRRLANAVRPGDQVARFGGDEFVVLCTGLDQDAVPALCDRLLQVLSEPVEMDGRLLEVGASIGVARAEDDASPATLLRDADAAMYAAKRAGRSRYMVSDEVVRGFAMAALTGESDLRAALAEGSLTLHAQPIRDLATMDVVGVETLARWPHPDRGELSPGSFVGVAVRGGMARTLGRWALREACRRRSSWAAAVGNPDLRVSVNLDAEHLVDPALVDDVRSALAASRMPARLLTIEITERSLVDAFPAIVSRLSELVDDGVRLSLDDFGTGWSSLSYLRLLPVAELKVDRAFVTGAARSPREAVLLAGIARLGRGLGLSVVAEGIEAAAELAVARANGCDLGQGYLLGRPAADGTGWPTPAWLLDDPAVRLAGAASATG